MKQKQYTDGSPSREIEDWETSGEIETRKLYERYRNKPSITACRDQLNNLESLISNCCSVMSCLEFQNAKTINDVCMVLLTFAIPKIESIGEQLKCLK